jgi:ATP-dependent Clp protease adapter protein ClpS
MFYADSTAALLSWKLLQVHRNGQAVVSIRGNDNGRGHM